MLACGEVRTCLLPAGQALDSRAAAQLLRLRADERVLVSERPNLHGRSPDTLTGVDCPLPSANGARVRAVGTVAARAALTEGRVLQTSAYFTLPASGPDHRRPWGDYLMRPGVVEPLGKLPCDAVAAGLLDGGRHGDLDVGLIAGGLLTRLLRHPLLDQRPPLRSRQTRLRWVALTAPPGEAPAAGAVHPRRGRAAHRTAARPGGRPRRRPGRALRRPGPARLAADHPGPRPRRHPPRPGRARTLAPSGTRR